MSRDAAVLTLPVERDSPIDLYGRGGSLAVQMTLPRASFSTDSRFFVVAGLDRGSSSLLIADLAEARVVARLPNGGQGQWAIGPAGKVLVVGERAGETPQLRAYALATGRPIGEPISGPLPLWDSRDPLLVLRPRRSQDGPDNPRAGRQHDRRVEILGLGVRQGPEDTDPWKLDSSNALAQLAYFDASGTRLLISARQKPEPANSRQGRPATASNRHVIELWDLAGPRRLMSTADVASEVVSYNWLRFDPRGEAFVTFHNPPQRGKDGIGAIVWETSTGKVLGR